MKYFGGFVDSVNLVLKNLCNTNEFLFTNMKSNYLVSKLPLNINKHGKDLLFNNYLFYLSLVMTWKVCDKDKSHIRIICLLAHTGSKNIHIQKFATLYYGEISLYPKVSIIQRRKLNKNGKLK